jgi:hypothetical protein
VPLDLLTKAVMTVPGVKGVPWTSPAADLVVPRDGMARLESMEFDVAVEAEP